MTPPADPQTPLADPQTPLADPLTPVADPQTPLADAQTPLTDPQRFMATETRPLAGLQISWASGETQWHGYQIFLTGPMTLQLARRPLRLNISLASPQNPLLALKPPWLAL